MNKIEQLIIGSMLGDGYLCKISGNAKNSRLSIAHSPKQKEYCEFKFNILKEVDLATKISYSKIYNNRYKNGYIEEYRFKSRSNSIFTEYRTKFYPNGKKVLDFDIINNINELGLCIWFLDDAHKTKCGYQINTQSFSRKEVEYLRDILKQKFDINTTYQKFDNIIYILCSDVIKLDSLILPYVIESMKYKIFNVGPE